MSTASIEELVVRQEELKKSITRLSINFKKLGKEKRTVATATARREVLKESWNQFASNHMQLCLKASTDDKASLAYFTEDTYEGVEEEYIAQRAYFDEMLGAVTKSEAKERPSGLSLQLPKIDVPKFSGVSGEAEKLIRNIAVTAANFETAWQKLNKRFENKRVLVHAHLKSLFGLHAARQETAGELKSLLDGTSQAVTALKTMGRPTDHWDDILVYVTTNKLDANTRKDWEVQLGEEIPSFAELEAFLERRIRALENVQPSTTRTQRSNNQNSAPKNSDVKAHNASTVPATGSSPTSSANATNTEIQPSRTCNICSGKHSFSFCSTFKRKNAQQRREFVEQIGACTNCLKGNHRVEACPSDKTCLRCQQKHHTMLHNRHEDATSTTPSSRAPSYNVVNQPPSPTNATPCTSSSEQTPQLQVHLAANSTASKVLLATAIVRVSSPSGTTARLRALVDPGAESSFIRDAIASELSLPRKGVHVAVTGLGGVKAANAKSRTTLMLHSVVDSRVSLLVEALILPNLTGLIPGERVCPHKWAHVQGLQLADPNYYEPNKVDLILGADVWPHMILEGIRKGPVGTPFAQNTVFGWILSGAVHNESEPNVVTRRSSSGVVCHNITTAPDLNQSLQRFWELEELPTASRLTDDERQCEQHFDETHSREQDGRYVVRLPFLQDPTTAIGESRSLATKLFLRQERSLEKRPEVAQQYTQFLSEYEQLRHMEEIPERDSKKPVYYMPHHAVLRDSSATTRLRVVFNASQKSTSGFSLNEILHTGPRLQRDLIAVLIAWRKHEVALTADIEKMFRQIRVHPEDQDWQRIVWRNSPEGNIREYRMTTVTYGTACAPYLSLKVMQQLARDERGNYPLGSAALEDDFYVDDLLSGAPDMVSAQNLQHQLLQLLSSGGFKLRKWASNRNELLENLQPEDRAYDTPKPITPDETVRTLGLVWHPACDQLAFQFSLPEITLPVTKRRILADAARLFDPLGLIAPVTITAKILLQDLWIDKLDWDEPLPGDAQKRWQDYRGSLQTLKALRVPRWFGTSQADTPVELHGFSDASRRAYGAVVYIRVLNEDHTAFTRMIAAKSKVSPIKEVSIPRLELCGAVMLVRLVVYVHETLKLGALPIHLWTDSELVLKWLKAHPSRWKTFVANRVSEIQTAVPRASWRHVAGAENPADLVTRGTAPSELCADSRWWTGPSWLKQHSTYWPRGRFTLGPDTDPEERTDQQVHTAQLSKLDPVRSTLLERHSSLTELLRTTAIWRRYLKRLQTKTFDEPAYLTAVELKAASRFWTRSVQAISFPEDIIAIREGKTLPKSSRLSALNPFLDSEGIVRVGGRLHNSMLSYEAKHPAILPANSAFTRMIVAHSHESTLHGATTVTAAQVRRQFWILRGRNLVRNYIRTCVRCARLRLKPETQQMGRLPAERIRPCRAFCNTGLDYAGPISIRSATGRGFRVSKAYIALFVCLATRAVHIEAVTDLGTEAFLAAFGRFASRRGPCATLWSDNQTSFHGADSELKILVKQLSEQQPRLAAQLATQGIEWKFIPPASPHFGGIWEAGIKSTKHHLKRIIGAHKMTYEELSTVLARIEACLNSRPLYPMTEDPEDLNALTPGHFLVGTALTAIPEPSLLDIPENRLSRWQMLSHLTQQFWRQWAREYLHYLQTRRKWKQAQPSLQPGDLVVIKSDNEPPASWPLGRVQQVFPGSDGHVRVADVQTARTRLKRPVTKLCRLPLPLSPEEAESQDHNAED